MHIARLRELDGIRGVACLLVLLDHVIVSELPSDWPGLHRLAPWLIGGVDLFFVLSGFLIGGILIDSKSSSNYFKVFWIRRFARIMPVYYLLMITFFLVLFVKPYLNAPWLDLFLFKNIMPLWTYPFFVQNFAQSFDGGTGGARWVASTWSLAIEEQFYLLLPLLIYVLSRRWITAVAALCMVAALIVRAHLWQATGNDMHAYFLLPGRMDSLAAGLLGALSVRSADAVRWLQRYRRILDVAAAATVVLLSVKALEFLGNRIPDTLSYLVRSSDFTLRSVLFTYAIMRVFLVTEKSFYRRLLSTPLLVFTGTISYALYMYHPAINGLLHGLLFANAPAINSFPQLLVAFAVIAVSVGLAWLSTIYFEFPIRRWSHRMTYKTVLSKANIPEFSNAGPFGKVRDNH